MENRDWKQASEQHRPDSNQYATGPIPDAGTIGAGFTPAPRGKKNTPREQQAVPCPHKGHGGPLLARVLACVQQEGSNTVPYGVEVEAAEGEPGYDTH